MTLAQPLAASDDTVVRRRRSPIRRVLGYWSAGWLVLLVVVAVAAPILPIDDPLAIDIANKLSPPGTDGHLLGTDGLGRDILSRLVYGARVSLFVSVVAVGIGFTLGGLLGLVAGYFRGHLDTGLSAVIDVILAFPGMVLLLGVIAFVGQSLTTVTITIGLLSIPIYMRISRANSMGVADRDYVLASRLYGARDRRILRRDILPNVVMPVVAFALVSLGVVIVLEGGLAFLGLSVPPPTASWGTMISEGKRHLRTDPYLVVMPSLAMFITVMALNVQGERLRARWSIKRTAD
ncbi:MAG: ABC transporter permease [Ilumatobacter fluminis]|uniref:Peptide/nickel transport system permease protein n=1 Tax=Ilumatobacter fluminis TaxID=467091 RepID=A0A4R7HVI4_9ACTN|nr:ABC transporter permease [Ilumatobacter fluminis]TDT14962.1 peptide/nickel transport system permease protein [Ilumatobacter fluminis]